MNNQDMSYAQVWFESEAWDIDDGHHDNRCQWCAFEEGEFFDYKCDTAPCTPDVRDDGEFVYFQTYNCE